MPWRRTLAIWALMMLVETAHGIARTLWLAPWVGDFRARQVAVVTGSALVLTIAWIFIGWLRPGSRGACLGIGAVWVALTLAFELGLGRLLGSPWSRLLADYNVARGGLMPLGLVAMAVAPVVAAGLRHHPSGSHDDGKFSTSITYSASGRRIQRAKIQGSTTE